MCMSWDKCFLFPVAIVLESKTGGAESELGTLPCHSLSETDSAYGSCWQGWWFLGLGMDGLPVYSWNSVGRTGCQCWPSEGYGLLLPSIPLGSVTRIANYRVTEYCKLLFPINSYICIYMCLYWPIYIVVEFCSGCKIAPWFINFFPEECHVLL